MKYKISELDPKLVAISPVLAEWAKSYFYDGDLETATQRLGDFDEAAEWVANYILKYFYLDYLKYSKKVAKKFNRTDAYNELVDYFHRENEKYM